jgi:hypothetical protein
MRVRRAAPLALVVLAAVGVTHADAKPKKAPITKAYDVTGVPHPNPPSGPACSDSAEGVSEHRELLTVTGAGKLKVTVNGFNGDWDIGIYGKGDVLLVEGSGADTPPADPTTQAEETATLKSKKAQTISVDVCNFAGSPKAHVELTYVYN